MSQHNPHFLTMTADTLGKSLLQGLIQEIRILPDVWQKIPEKKQTEVIERLERQVRNAATIAVHTIAGGERETVYGKLESVAVKDKMKAVLVVNPSSPHKHDLLDAVNQDCLLIIGGAAEFLHGTDEVQADPDQNPLDLNGGDADMSEPGAWDGEAQDAEFTMLVEKFGDHTLNELALSITTKKSSIDQAYLQSRFALSSEQATRVILLLLDDGVIELETEGETPEQNVYRVIKAPDEIDME
ncbi:cell division protein FtsK [Azotobacter salinestris]|uniref:cell division protein FtsK n=1 Tax=Azotobacter salinestris TaxID=69964 RepID=UPI0012669D76|nr:cell division protein FtsK [Azotobacter salinestris]